MKTANYEHDLEYLSLLRATQEIYGKTVNKPGDWSNREENTFMRNRPNEDQLSKLQPIAQRLIKTNPAEKPELFLLECNCAVYASAVYFKSYTMEKKRLAMKDLDRAPKWLFTLDE